MKLNWDKNNYNFTIEILNKVFIDEFKKPLSLKAMIKIITGAKGVGKTILICLLTWFFTCNFNDWNSILARYIFKSARTNFHSKLMRTATLLQKYGVTIKQALDDKELKVKNNDNTYEIVWPNKRKIIVVGFDNSSDWEGKDAEVGEYALFGLDEVIPLDVKIDDESEYLYRLFNMIVQIARGQNIVVSTSEIDELTIASFSLKKEKMVLLGFNNHDVDHPIYNFFVQNEFPLTEKVEEQLNKKNVAWFNNPNFLNGLGITIIRATTEVNRKNLSTTVFDVGDWLKENKPEVYNSLFQGGEREYNLEKYSYRKELRNNLQFFDIQDFYWPDLKKVWFEFLSIGTDYADSVKGRDDTLQILTAIEFDKDDYVKAIYFCEELSISSLDFIDMTEKVAKMAEFIEKWSNIYYLLKNSLNYRIGHDSRTIGHFIREKLIQNHNWNKTTLENSFSTIIVTGAKGWKVEDRHYDWKRLLSERKIFFSKNLKVTKKINNEEVVIKEHGYLFDELDNCINNEKTNIRDERPGRNKLDAINAAECSLSFHRFKLFKD